MESGTSQAPDPAQTPDLFTWDVPGKPVVIRLDLDVVDRMQRDVMRGFGALKRRGAEVGGILLGTVERGDRVTVTIQDYEPVNCEYRFGPSYHLSDGDKEQLEAALQQWRTAPDRRLYAVGYYRSHTREGMSLGEEDHSLCARYFADPANVVLLVKPYATRVSMAGFFFYENGRLKGDETYREFPFRRRELGGGAAHPVVELPRSAESKPEARAPAVDPPKVQRISRVVPEDESQDLGSLPVPSFLNVPLPDVPDQSARRRWLWVPISVASLLLGGLLGFQGALSWKSAEQREATTQNPYSLELAVSRTGENLRLRWNPQSPAIRDARDGTLVVSEGTYRKTVPLTMNELQIGSAIYRRVTGQIQFRLEVNLGDRRMVSETVSWQEP